MYDSEKNYTHTCVYVYERGKETTDNKANEIKC